MNYSDILNSLPKPQTVEEQYIYALIRSIAGADYEEPFQSPFYRMDKYWKAFFEVMSMRINQPSKPAVNSVETAALQDQSVTKDKLATDVSNALLGKRKVTSEMLTYDLANRIDAIGDLSAENISDGAITEAKLSDDLKALLTAKVATDKIEDGAITLDKLSEDLQNKINSIGSSSSTGGTTAGGGSTGGATT